MDMVILCVYVIHVHSQPDPHTLGAFPFLLETSLQLGNRKRIHFIKDWVALLLNRLRYIEYLAS